MDEETSFPISNTVIDLCIMNENPSLTVFCLASSSPLESIQVWELNHKKNSQPFHLGKINVQSRVTAVKYHRINQNSGKIVSAHQNGMISIYDVDHDNEKAILRLNKQIECHKGPATAIAISNKYQIISVGEDGHLWCGDLKTGKTMINSLKISESPLNAVSFSEDDVFITASHSKLISLWDLKSSFKNNCAPINHFEEDIEGQNQFSHRIVWSIDCHPSQPLYISSTSSSSSSKQKGSCIMIHDGRSNSGPYPIFQYNDDYSMNIWKVMYNKADPNYSFSSSDDCTLSKIHFPANEEHRSRSKKVIVKQGFLPITSFDVDYSNRLILSTTEDEMLSVTPLHMF